MDNRYLKWRMTTIVLCLLVLGGCQGSGNPDAPLSTSAHEAGWRLMHDSEAQKDIVNCQVCHGADFTGNGTVPSCFGCHLGGPPFSIHPASLNAALPWKHPMNHGSAARANIKGCQGCHGHPGGPGSNPAFDTAIRGLEKGCESAVGCHNNTDMVNLFNNGHNPGAAHPSFDPKNLSKQDRRHWYGENIAYRDSSDSPMKNYVVSHFDAGNKSVACALCHGANLKGRAEGGVGPACTDCHVLDPIAYPSRCVSCHGPLPGQGLTGPPLKPLQLATLAGRTDFYLNPVFQTFTSELTGRMRRDPTYVRINPANSNSGYYFEPDVFTSFTSAAHLSRRSSHLHHDSLPCADRQDNTTCSVCHNDQNNMTRHHNLLFTKSLGCANCHQVSGGGGGFSLGNFRNCRDCHLEFFCP